MVTAAGKKVDTQEGWAIFGRMADPPTAAQISVDGTLKLYPSNEISPKGRCRGGGPACPRLWVKASIIVGRVQLVYNDQQVVGSQ